VKDNSHSIELASRRDLNAGAIVASPCIDGNLLFVATLGGEIICLDMSVTSEATRSHDMGGNDFLSVLWRHSFGCPLFSSPLVHRRRLYVGCVDGQMHEFQIDGDGLSSTLIFHLKRTFPKCDGPIFSSPIMVELSKQAMDAKNAAADFGHGSYVIYASHDGFVYAHDVDDPTDCWRCSFIISDDESKGKTAPPRIPPMYSTPVAIYPLTNVFPVSLGDNRTSQSQLKYTLLACSADGRMRLINARSGEFVTELNTGAEIFSSPVAIPGTGKVLIGSRDDYLICYDLQSP